MGLPVITPRNQVQRIGSFLRGSSITVLGSGSQTETAVFNGVVSTYEPPAGKRARVKGIFVARAMGSNTVLICRVFDQNAAQFTDLVRLTAAGTQGSFDIELEPDNVVLFAGDNAADDGSASCIMEVEELPA